MSTCIYHSKDLDGLCSAAIVKKRYPEVVLRGYDYGEEFDVESLPEGDLVIMVDVSMPMEVMYAIQARTKNNFIWIDHHISAINAHKEYYNTKGVEANQMAISCVLVDGTAACELTWRYFYTQLPLPYAVKLLSHYDTWKNRDEAFWNGEVLPFQYGMRMHVTSPDMFHNEMWLAKGSSVHVKIMSDGAVVLKYIAAFNEKQVKANSFEAYVLGNKAICSNIGGVNSNFFDSVWDPGKYDLMVLFQMNKRKKFTVSFYTTKDDVDCSVIANNFGGGGHRKAAGCEVQDIKTLGILKSDESDAD